MKVQCSAPDCVRIVEVSRWALLKAKFYSITHGGNWGSINLCPAHLERMTGGRVSDNNPETNPDLEK